MAERSGSSQRRRRRWRFGDALFDEGSWALTVAGVAVALEAKPAELLLELLLHAGETVSKDELLDAVWPNVTVVEASLSVAVSKLRKALGDEGGELIETVPRIGYRLAAPVQVESLDAPLMPRFAFMAGDAVPGRGQWRLEAALGDSGAADVWRARHQKTGETRVFKFADAPDRLRSLRREAALARFLAGALGSQGPHVELLEWNFETSPFFLESRDGGDSLLGWAARRGGLAAVPRPERLQVAIEVAEAVAAVHGVGVLHRDLKPGNILLGEEAGGRRIRLADFGQGAVETGAGQPDPQITGLPFASEGGAPTDAPYGTYAYRAPEVAAGGVATVQSDVYALGLVVLQLVVGDFRATLAPGWEAAVADPLLAGDIAAASAGDPEARLTSAAALAERLRTLDARRAALARAEADAARLAELAAAAETRRARRPWLIAAVGAGVLGLAGTSAGLVLAQRQRDEAVRQQAIAEASYAFLAEDLLARVDPARAGQSDETLVEAAERASKDIGRRFASQPLVAATLFHSLGRAFDQRANPDSARRSYSAAIASYLKAGEEGRDEAAIAYAQMAQLEALTGDPSRLGAAKNAIARAESLRQPGSPRSGFWLANARGSLLLASNDVTRARQAYSEGLALAKANPSLFSERQRLNQQQRVAFISLRLGDGAEAERLLKPIEQAFLRLSGPTHPDTLMLQLGLVQALMVSKRHEEAVAAATALLPKMERGFGKEHRHTMQVLASRQQSLGSLERYAEAAQDGTRVFETATRRDGPGSFQAVAGRVDTATSQCRAGLVDEGLANARAALSALEAAGDRESALHMAVRSVAGDCLIAAGAYAAAREMLAGIDRDAVARLVGDANWGANLDVALAEAAFGLGDRREAERRLSAAAPSFRDPAKDPFQTRRVLGLQKKLAA